MKVAELLAQRRADWQQLEREIDQLQARRRQMTADRATRFAELYRAACADLARADAWQLPPRTVQYLHRLVGRAHNQLYRSRTFNFAVWGRVLLHEVPGRIVRDPCVQLAFLLFWGVFFASAFLAFSPATWPNYAEQMLTTAGIEQLETSFANPLAGRELQDDVVMTSLYIRHNTSIGLKCFAGGLLVIPGVFITLFNAAYLGAAFGYMARPEVVEGVHFFEFVTAHGPFELTAIVLSAGAGFRLGVAWLAPGRLCRLASLRRAAEEAMPVMGAAMSLFFLAALIEGFISPAALPWGLKLAVALFSAAVLVFYLVFLGSQRSGADAVG